MSTVSYEVTATVREDLRGAFEAFMIEVHMPEVMAIGAFLNARLSTVGPGIYRASYTAPSREALGKYLVEHSPRLREDVEKHFPVGLAFPREEWTLLASF